MNAPLCDLQPYIPFAVPDIGEAEIAEVVDSLRSGWITSGPKTKHFEAAFAEYLGGDVIAIAVNSATAGLHLAVEALGIGPGDEVIVPVHTFTATAEVVRYVGADPIFVDVDPVTLNCDAGAVESAIGPKTRAIMPVHYGGLAADMVAIMEVASRHGLAIIEDAAHALPATTSGTLIGALPTRATVFSFYATKTLATGEGGMVVTRDRALADRVRVMRLHGISTDVFDRYRSGGWYYEVIAPGFKYNMTDLAAAIGIHQLKRLGEMHARRVAIAERYTEAFRDMPLILPANAPAGDVHAWHLYPVRLDDGAPAARDTLIAALKDRSIGSSVHYVPLHFHPYWRDRYRLRPEDFPVSTWAFERMVSLPIYSRMDDLAVARVIESVRRCLSTASRIGQ